MFYRLIFVLCLIAAMKVEAQQLASPLLNQGFGVTNSLLRTQEIEAELAMRRLQRSMDNMQQQLDSTESRMNQSIGILNDRRNPITEIKNRSYIMYR